MLIRIVWEFVDPTATLPKFALEGVRLIAGAMPAPVTGTLKGELLALLVTVTLPDTLPAVVGANTTLRVADAAAFTVIGVVSPFPLNPVPVATTLAT